MCNVIAPYPNTSRTASISRDRDAYSDRATRVPNLVRESSNALFLALIGADLDVIVPHIWQPCYAIDQGSFQRFRREIHTIPE